MRIATAGSWGYKVIVTRYLPPEKGLTKSIDSVRYYKTENGARQHCLKNYDKPYGEYCQLFERMDGEDQIIAEIVPSWINGGPASCKE